MSKVRRLILVGNTKGYEGEDHTAKRFKVNTRMISASRKEKSILVMNQGANIETEMVLPMGI